MTNKSSNKNLHKAKDSKNDEFYTQYFDIEKEMNAYLEYDPDVFRGKSILLPCDDPEWSNFTKYFAQNFELLGLRKLISTSYAPDSKKIDAYVPTLFEMNDPQYDNEKSQKCGKIFILTEDKSGDGKIDINDLGWTYLKGDGDFRSAEIKKLRDEADIVITNPPFSLFREFLTWIVEANKKFVLIANKNCITYKEVFPQIKNNRIWVGATSFNKDMLFLTSTVIESINKPKTSIRSVDGTLYLRSPSVWFTNLDHGRRHQPLQLMTMVDNLKFNKKLRGKHAYVRYDNYDAIEVPFTEAIPSDYDGVMGVPISFLDKYNPEQFILLGSNRGIDQDINKVYGRSSFLNGKETFKRIFIKHR